MSMRSKAVNFLAISVAIYVASCTPHQLTSKKKSSVSTTFENTGRSISVDSMEPIILTGLLKRPRRFVADESKKLLIETLFTDVHLRNIGVPQPQGDRESIFLPMRTRLELKNSTDNSSNSSSVQSEPSTRVPGPLTKFPWSLGGQKVSHKKHFIQKPTIQPVSADLVLTKNNEIDDPSFPWYPRERATDYYLPEWEIVDDAKTANDVFPYSSNAQWDFKLVSSIEKTESGEHFVRVPYSSSVETSGGLAQLLASSLANKPIFVKLDTRNASKNHSGLGNHSATPLHEITDDSRRVTTVENGREPNDERGTNLTVEHQDVYDRDNPASQHSLRLTDLLKQQPAQSPGNPVEYTSFDSALNGENVINSEPYIASRNKNRIVLSSRPRNTIKSNISLTEGMREESEPVGDVHSSVNSSPWRRLVQTVLPSEPVRASEFDFFKTSENRNLSIKSSFKSQKNPMYRSHLSTSNNGINRKINFTSMSNKTHDSSIELRRNEASSASEFAMESAVLGHSKAPAVLSRDSLELDSVLNLVQSSARNPTQNVESVVAKPSFSLSLFDESIPTLVQEKNGSPNAALIISATNIHDDAHGYNNFELFENVPEVGVHQTDLAPAATAIFPEQTTASHVAVGQIVTDQVAEAENPDVESQREDGASILQISFPTSPVTSTTRPVTAVSQYTFRQPGFLEMLQRLPVFLFNVASLLFRGRLYSGLA